MGLTIGGGARVEKARLLETRARMLSRGVLRPKGDSLSICLRSLALMMTSGIRINSALLMLGKQGDDLVMRDAAAGLAQEIDRGHQLSQGMLCYPNVFSDFHVSLVL